MRCGRRRPESRPEKVSLGVWPRREDNPYATAFRGAKEKARKEGAAKIDPAHLLPFGEWMARHRPESDWSARHFRVMQETLDRVTSGELKRVIFQIPIRHGKTSHNTYGYLSKRFAADPKFRGLLVSYNQPQVQKFSRDIRRLVRGLGVPLSEERDSAGEWETAGGGGLRAVGIGSGTASINADGIVIDDPIGNRDDAESEAKRGQVFDALTNDILARTEPHTWVILSMSRWHKDDPVGRLLDQQPGRWHVVDLPAEAEENDPLGREVGEPLWPELRSKEWLAEKRVELGSYGFASLLQGRPRPRSGGMFDWDWWRLLDTEPVCTRYIRYWDLAGTTPQKGKSDPDFSAGTLEGRMMDGRTCIIHQAAFQRSVAARDAEMLRIARLDKQRYGFLVEWCLETETGIGGRARTDALKLMLHGVGLVVNEEPATQSKPLRAEPLASAAEAGNVCLAPDDPTAPWRDAFRLEAADAPFGNHDDRWDSAAGAYNRLTLIVPGSVAFDSLEV